MSFLTEEISITQRASAINWFNWWLLTVFMKINITGSVSAYASEDC